MGKTPKKGKKHKQSKLAKLKTKFKAVYKSWGDKTFCSSLGEDVFFTDTGWDHISDGRTKPQTERRLKLLPLSKKLIEESLTPPVLSFRIRQGKKTAYYVFRETLDNVDIVAVLIRPRGRYTFLSDFEKT